MLPDRAPTSDETAFLELGRDRATILLSAGGGQWDPSAAAERLFNRSLRYSESILKVGDELCVLGQAGPGHEMPLVSEGPDLFMVTDSPEDSLRRRYQLQRLGGAIVVLGTVLAMLFQQGLLG